MTLSYEDISRVIAHSSSPDTLINTYNIKGIKINLLVERLTSGSVTYTGEILDTNNNVCGIIHYTFVVYPCKMIDYQTFDTFGNLQRIGNQSMRKHMRETCKAIAYLHRGYGVCKLH